MRRKAVWAAGAVATLGLALAAGPMRRWQRGHAGRRALTELSWCLWGATPDATDADRRWRGARITAATDRNHAAWPGRCAPAAERLTAAAREAHRERLRCEGRCCADDARCPLLAEVGVQARAARRVADGQGEAGFDPLTLLAAADPLGWVARDGATPEGPRAPEAAKVVDARQVEPVFRGDYLRLLTDPAGDRSLDLLFYEHQTRYAHCLVDLGEGGRPRCRPLPESVPVGFAGELLAAERGAPARMYAQGPSETGWRHGLFDLESGTQLTAVPGRPSGGFVWRDGTTARIDVAPPVEAPARVRPRGGVEEAPRMLDVGAVSSGPRLVWDEVVWTQPLGDGRHRLHVQRVLPGADALGKVVELGTVGPLDGKPSFDICRTGRALVLVVQGRRTPAAASAAMVFRVDGVWRAPQSFRISTGAYGLTCRDAQATLSWVRAEGEEPDPSAGPPPIGDPGAGAVRGTYRVHRVRCTPDACKHAQVGVPLSRYARASRYVAGDLGDAMILMWRSPLGDVRMRLAPLMGLGRAPDVPLFDDVEHDGFGWDLERDPIFGRAGSVLVLVSRQLGTSTDSATYALRIEADGKVTALSPR